MKFLKRQAKDMGKLKKDIASELGIPEDTVTQVANSLIKHPLFIKHVTETLPQDPTFYNHFKENLVEEMAKDKELRERVIGVFSDFVGRRSFLAMVGGLATSYVVGTQLAGADTVIPSFKGGDYYTNHIEIYDVIVGKEEAGNKLKVRAYNTLGKRIADGLAGTSLDNPGDDAKVINNALDILSTGGLMYLSSGYYYIDEPIIIKFGRTTLSGSGKSTILMLANNANCDIIQSDQISSGKWIPEIEINRIYLYGNNKNNNNGSGMHIYTWRGIINNVTIDNVKEYGIRIRGGTDSKIIGSTISNCYIGVWLDVSDIMLSTSEIYQCAAAIDTWGGMHQIITNNWIWGCSTGIIMRGNNYCKLNDLAASKACIEILYHYPQKYNIIANTFRPEENCKCVYIGNTPSQGIRNINISSNSFIGDVDGIIAILLDNREYNSIPPAHNYITANQFIGGFYRKVVLTDKNFIGIPYIYFRGNTGLPQVDNDGVTSITGDGTTTSFTVNVAHGLIIDNINKIAVSITPSQGTLDGYSLVDLDGDGFKETLQFTVSFAAAPASGAVIPVSWSARVA